MSTLVMTGSDTGYNQDGRPAQGDNPAQAVMWPSSNDHIRFKFDQLANFTTIV